MRPPRSVSDDPQETLHRLANDVLAHALFPEAAEHPDPATQERLIKKTMRDVIKTLDLMIRFFEAAAAAHLKDKCHLSKRMEAAGPSVAEP